MFSQAVKVLLSTVKWFALVNYATPVFQKFWFFLSNISSRLCPHTHGVTNFEMALIVCFCLYGYTRIYQY